MSIKYYMKAQVTYLFHNANNNGYNNEVHTISKLHVIQTLYHCIKTIYKYIVQLTANKTIMTWNVFSALFCPSKS